MRTIVTILLAIILAVVAVLAFGVAVCASDAGHPWVSGSFAAPSPSFP